MPFSDSEYSDSTDSTMYSGGSSDLDETSHHGQRHAKGSPTIGREFTSHGMNRGDDLDSSYSKNSYSSKKWNRIQSFPEPTYNVVLASNIKVRWPAGEGGRLRPGGEVLREVNSVL